MARGKAPDDKHTETLVTAKRLPKAPAIDIDHVLQVAADLFAEHGFDGLSTREIAKACGCRLPSIYYHFGNKETLYREAFSNKLEDTIDEIQRQVDDSALPEEKVRQMVAAFFSLFTQDRTLLLLVQRDIAEVSLPNRQFLCRQQHVFFLRYIRDLASEALGITADPNTVFIINGMLLGYCEFYNLVQEAGEKLPGESNETRLASLQEAVLKLLRD